MDRKQSYKVPNIYTSIIAILYKSNVAYTRVNYRNVIHKGLDQSVQFTITNIFAGNEAALHQRETIAAANQLEFDA